MNIMAENQGLMAAFRPSTFNGLHTTDAAQWWNSFLRYLQLSGIQEQQRPNVLGLLLSGTALLWFDALPEADRNDFGRLEAAFRNKYVVSAPTSLQRQMHTLSQMQQPAETVEEYVADFRSKMHNFGYNDALQMTLVLNGLRSEIKAIAMQHLPFDNLDALVTKARHIEAALKSYNPVQSAHLHSAGTSGLHGTAVNAVRQDQDIEAAIRKAMEPLHNKLSAFMQQSERGRYGGPTQQVSPPRNFQGNQRFRQQGPPKQRYNNPGDKRCYHCDSKFHFQRDCPHASQEKTRFPPRGSYQGFKRNQAPNFRSGGKPYNNQGN